MYLLFKTTSEFMGSVKLLYSFNYCLVLIFLSVSFGSLIRQMLDQTQDAEPESDMTQILEISDKVFKITIVNMPCVKYGPYVHERVGGMSAERQKL